MESKKLTAIVATCLVAFKATASLPQATVNVESSSQFGLVVNPRYVNILSPTSALGLDLAFGGKEFRMGATWAKLLQVRHRLKATMEYMAQEVPFVFVRSENHWSQQHAFAAEYTYIPGKYGLSGIYVGAYHAGARSEQFFPDVPFFNDPSLALTRNIAGSSINGAHTGITVQPWRRTRVNTQVFYDNLVYHNHFEYQPSRSGIGAGITLEQALHPRFLVEFEANYRQLYQHYLAKMSWLLLARSGSRLELSMIGQYINGNIPRPHETRVGVMLSYRWHVMPMTCPCFEILEMATKPVVRMPRTFVSRDATIVRRPLP